MESHTEAAAAATSDPSETRTFSQVVFTDIPHSYLPSTPVTCSYTLTAAFQPNPRDWVGIFKVGWSTCKDYHTFVWAEPCLDVVGEKTVARQAVFKDYYLPKDEIEFYQFCYIDFSGTVRGASTPFCFRNTAENSIDCSADDDLLVITTQEQVEQSVREKAELQKDLKRTMEENQTLKTALETERVEFASLKAQNETKEKENVQLLKDLDQIKEENETLKSTLGQQQKDKEQLQEQMKLQQQNTTEQMSKSLMSDGAARQNESHAQEKYDRAVLKINQLKGEREELRATVEEQSGEIDTLKSKLGEGERELLTLKDNIQLLQVDLKSSEKENERVCAELQSLKLTVEEVKRENQELNRSLTQQTAIQTCPDDDLKLQFQRVVGQLHDAERKLSSERETCQDAKRRSEYLDRELTQLKAQMENVCESYEQEQQKSGKHQLLHLEAMEEVGSRDKVIQDNERMITLVTQEREELARDNQKLLEDMEGLRRHVAELLETPPSDTPDNQPGNQPGNLYDDQPGNNSPAGNTADSAAWQQPDTPEEPENIYENIPSLNAEQVDEASLVCRHCQEIFPCITQQELEQHEQSHRVCPFCTMICDNMEQTVFEDHVYSHEV